MKIVSASHVDHGLTQAQRDFLVERFADRKAFFIEEVLLPSELGSVPCALRGPKMGDSPVIEDVVVYQRRGSRAYESRMIRLPARQCYTVTVIAGPYEGETDIVLYTAFGGPLTPREPGDPTLKPEEKDASVSFWKDHALATAE